MVNVRNRLVNLTSVVRISSAFGVVSILWLSFILMIENNNSKHVLFLSVTAFASILSTIFGMVVIARAHSIANAISIRGKDIDMINSKYLSLANPAIVSSRLMQAVFLILSLVFGSCMVIFD